MSNSKQKITSDDFYALLCDCSGGDKEYLLCGVFASKKEAQECGQSVKDCAAQHIIKKCSVAVIF